MICFVNCHHLGIDLDSSQDIKPCELITHRGSAAAMEAGEDLESIPLNLFQI